jgi:hypothetical protein
MANKAPKVTKVTANNLVVARFCPVWKYKSWRTEN